MGTSAQGRGLNDSWIGGIVIQGIGPSHTPPAPGEMPVMRLADVSWVRRKWLDVPYATLSPTQKLDVYLPDKGKGPFPVVVYVHGGAFAIGDKGSVGFERFLPGIERGYAVVSIDYRLSGEAIFPAALEDVKAAIRWVKGQSPRFHLDPDRVAIGGVSAGGNLAAMAGVTSGLRLYDDPALGNSDQTSDVHAVVDLFGPTDFLKMDEQLAASGLGPCNHNDADSPESLYLGRRITETPEMVELANPITHVHKGMPPILIQHGTLDSDVPVQQSVEFAKAIADRVGTDRVLLDIVEGGVHADLAFGTEENVARIFDFLDGWMK